MPGKSRRKEQSNQSAMSISPLQQGLEEAPMSNEQMNELLAQQTGAGLDERRRQPIDEGDFDSRDEWQEAIYAHGEEAQPEFELLVNGLVARTGATETLRVKQPITQDDRDQVNSNPQGHDVELAGRGMKWVTNENMSGAAPTKAKGKSMDKMTNMADPRLICDIVRGTLSYSDFSKMINAVEIIQGTDGVTIVRAKNKFKNINALGYGDLQLQLKMSNGHTCELQLHMDIVLQSKEMQHESYDQFTNNTKKKGTPKLADVEDPIDRALATRAVHFGHDVNQEAQRQIHSDPDYDRAMALFSTLA